MAKLTAANCVNFVQSRSDGDSVSGTSVQSAAMTITENGEGGGLVGG